MTLQEIKAKLFPAIYKTRNGKIVEITGFAFVGHFIDNPDRQFVWDGNMNYLIPNRLYGSNNVVDPKDLDCIKLIKNPSDDIGKKKFTYSDPKAKP